jgi:hypothetical protein
MYEFPNIQLLIDPYFTFFAMLPYKNKLLMAIITL